MDITGTQITRNRRLSGTVVHALIACAVLALAGAASAEELRTFTPACETALALSAGPENLHDKAGVYVLGEDGYELTRPADNGFYCLVERNHPDSVIPQCFDTGSREANLAKILEEGRMLRAGKSFEELREHREKALADGKYASAGPGLVYMISDYNYIFVPRRKGMIKVAPHVMYHAPNLTPADIGSDPQVAMANRGLPIVTAQGPHGYMTAFTERSSTTPAVERECKGQLPDPTEMPRFP